MTLELNKVTEQIDHMGRMLAVRAKRAQGILPEARQLLHRFAREQELLRDVAESEVGQRLRCASPGDEPLDGSCPAPAMPERVTLAAADGSQVYPDRHGVAFYYVINIGSIVFRHGSGQAPAVATLPELCYTEDLVYPGGVAITGDLVSARRDLAEMRVLTERTLNQEVDGHPRLALADGPLLMWLHRATVPEEQRRLILDDYLACLDRFRAGGVSVAGFVSRPQSAEVVALLYLAQLAPEERQAINSLAETDFRGLADRVLFGNLEPGQRSALFVRGTAANRDFRSRGHSVYFFYLNTGEDLARVEIPEWVTRKRERLDLVHAAVYDQSRFNSGYPYILTRADEQAVILGEERAALEAMIVQAMARHGLSWPELSRKAQQKQAARWRRRH